MNKKVTILIPTYNRIQGLIATLTALSSQTYKNFNVIIADQSDHPVKENIPIQAIKTILELHGNYVFFLRNLPRQGIAQQRQFLLDHTQSDFCFFLDDDVLLEPDVLERLVTVIEEEQCGFVGMGLIGWKHIHDVRPAEQNITFWESHVTPEQVLPDTIEWQRYKLHNAANLLHVAQKLELTPATQKKYKGAWIGACVLYDTKKLKDCGGFSFWEDLPKEHCGEDVLAQIKLMEHYGGCGIIPSGAYHIELPTTIQMRNIDAPRVLLKHKEL